MVTLLRTTFCIKRLKLIRLFLNFFLLCCPGLVQCNFYIFTWKMTKNANKRIMVVFNGDFVMKKIPLLASGFEPTTFRPMSSCCSCSLLMVVGLLLSHQVGPKLVASTLGDLVAVASKLLWPRPELSQGLYIQLSSRPSAWLTSSRNRARLKLIRLCFSRFILTLPLTHWVN